MKVVQLGRILSPPAVFTPRGAPVDVCHSSELHGYRADLGLLLELKGDLSCDPVTTGEGPALVIQVIIDVEVCYRLLEHYLKSNAITLTELLKQPTFHQATTTKRHRFRHVAHVRPSPGCGRGQTGSFTVSAFGVQT